ncbi:hypothetical protein NIBR502772_11155 [Pseudarthrobacter sp. NIBRBAC000502772]|uniref:hypothetical protein n=1 Tax=Pseudarthrobacter sp. NIBRBAC000502772 TaxID=2590775 RepID=UPI0011302732|nr:hypothetical protein [Pseudarthrobacter sp. NIBRBAC000502772]QDG66688.1 hypothetical protein NIBR502772_11155 [Pseudarthrobacter sp. NIBRBAC000502772]
MLYDQNTSDFSALAQNSAGPPHENVSMTQDAALDSHVIMVSSWHVHRDGSRPMTYSDYYCMMSLADYLEWIQTDDGSAPPISFSNV